MKMEHFEEDYDVEMQDDDISTDTEVYSDSEQDSDSSTLEHPTFIPPSPPQNFRSASMVNIPFDERSANLQSSSDYEPHFPPFALHRTRSDIPGAIGVPISLYLPTQQEVQAPSVEQDRPYFPMIQRTRSDQPAPVPMQCFSIPSFSTTSKETSRDRKVGQKQITPPSPLEPNIFEPNSRYNAFSFSPYHYNTHNTRSRNDLNESSESTSTEDDDEDDMETETHNGFRTPPKLLKPDSNYEGRWVSSSQDPETSPYAPSTKRSIRASASFPVTPVITVEEIWSKPPPTFSIHESAKPQASILNGSSSSSSTTNKNSSNSTSTGTINAQREQLHKKSSPSEGSASGGINCTLGRPVPMLKDIPASLHKSTPILQHSTFAGRLEKGPLSRSETAPCASHLSSSSTGFQYEAPPHPLPVIDQKYITPETVSKLIRGEYYPRVKRLIVIDCRYKYEFDGGHITNAISVVPAENSNLLPLMFMKNAQLDEGLVVIFHCEFSSKRGPDAWNHLRDLDRTENLHKYPYLHYPFMYIMQGGYKQFFDQYSGLCTGGYITMKDKRFSEDLLRNTRERKRHSAIRGLAQSMGANARPLWNQQKENLENFVPGRVSSSSVSDGHGQDSVRQKSRKYRCMDRSNVSLPSIPERIHSNSFGSLDASPGILTKSVDGIVRSCSYDRNLSDVMDDLCQEDTLLMDGGVRHDGIVTDSGDRSSSRSSSRKASSSQVSKKKSSRISGLKTNLSKRFNNIEKDNNNNNSNNTNTNL